MTLRHATIFLPAVLSACLLAANPCLSSVDTPAYALKGEAEAGAVTTSGNTDSKTFNAKGRITLSGGRFAHEGRASFLFASERGDSTAQRIIAGVRTSYSLTGKDYVFAAARYEDDRFSGYAYSSTVSAGYGRKFEKGALKASAEAGPGWRRSELEDAGAEDELIGRLSVEAEVKLGERSAAGERLNMETGSEGTVTGSETYLKAAINSNLAMKAAHEIRHTSSAPADRKKTDTLTSLTLVYSF